MSTIKPLQAQSFTLYGSGATLGATTLILTTFKDIDENNITETMLGGAGVFKAYMTLEPRNGTQEEQISFTGLTQNANGTCTLSGIKTVLFATPYTETSGLAKTHVGGSTAILSNTSAFYNQFSGVGNDNDWTGANDFTGGSITVPAPTVDADAATKKYVDDQDALDVHLTGNQTVAGVKTFTSLPSIPVTPSANGDAASKKYVDDTITGFTGTATSTSYGTTKLSSDPATPGSPVALNSEEVSTTAAANKVPRAGSGGQLDASWVSLNFGDGSDGDVTISSPTTLTRDMYYNNLVVTSTLTTDGFTVYVKGTISGAGTIKWGTPNNGANGSGTTAGAAGAAGGSGRFKNAAGGAGGNGSVGASGAAGAAGNSPSAVISPGADGGAGGSGGRGNGGGAAGAASAGGVATDPIIKLGTISALSLLGYDLSLTGTLAPYVGAGGGGGGGGGAAQSAAAPDGNGGSGGGGGASGGLVMIVAKTWTGTFTIDVAGGNGGNGSNNGNSSTNEFTGAGAGGGGGGGAGGTTIVIYGTKTWTGSYTVTGGTGGTKGIGPTSGGGVVAAQDGTAGTTGISYEILLSSLTR